MLKRLECATKCWILLKSDINIYIHTHWNSGNMVVKRNGQNRLDRNKNKPRMTETKEIRGTKRLVMIQKMKTKLFWHIIRHKILRRTHLKGEILNKKGG